MLKQKLRNEYELRYRIMQYKKLQKRYIYKCYESNNVNMLFEAISRVNCDKC